jgi:hypothetical protein
VSAGRMTSGGIVEPLDVIEHICPCLVPGAIGFARRGSVLSDEKKLSIAALSQTLPERLIEQTTRWSAINLWNCSLVYWAAAIRMMQQRVRSAPSPSSVLLDSLHDTIVWILACVARGQSAERVRINITISRNQKSL